MLVCMTAGPLCLDQYPELFHSFKKGSKHADKRERGATGRWNTLRKVKKAVKPDGGINLPIVGIGASAGGLETLNAFFSIMPPDSGMAFVVIQHLSPKHKSIMASLLDKHTQMSVVQIEDGTRVEPQPCLSESARLERGRFQQPLAFDGTG